jgi:hypothetical protein
MGFFTKSPSTTGAQSIISTLIPTLYFWGSIALGIYILVSTVYCLFGWEYEDVFTSSTTMTLACIHIILFISVAWAYVKVRVANPGYIPRPDRLKKQEVRALEEGNLNIVTPNEFELMDREFMVCKPDGSPKTCTTCHIYRPERTSHCSQTGRCVAKYDHYCPFLSSPIGVGNYKYYINFLINIHLLVSYLFAMGIVTVLKIGRNGWTITLLAFSAVILVSITPLLGQHIYMVLNNITTRENAFCRNQQSRNSKDSVHENENLLIRCNVTLFWPNYRLALPIPDFASLPPILVKLDLSNKPWKQSMWENWTGVMGVRWWRWFLPLSPYIEQERWWECEFNERTKGFLRETGHNMLKDILADKLVTKPEKAHEDEPRSVERSVDLQGSQKYF